MIPYDVATFKANQCVQVKWHELCCNAFETAGENTRGLLLVTKLPVNLNLVKVSRTQPFCI